MSDNDPIENEDEKPSEGKGFRQPTQPPAPAPAPIYIHQEPQRRNGLMTFITVMIVLTGIVVIPTLLIVGNLFEAAGASKGDYQETLLRKGDTGKKVVVIDIAGVISSDVTGSQGSTQDIISQLRLARDDKKVVAIVLNLNTPGGEVTATDEVHHEIQKVRQTGKKVITCMRSVAASGGYYIAAGTDYIFANRLTITGSIGVIIAGFNYHGLMDKIGVEPKVYQSGEFKQIISSGSKTSEEYREREEELVQKMVDETFGEFVKIITEGRNLKEEVVRAAPIGDARLLSGSEALKLNLVDQLGYLDDAVNYACQNENHSIVQLSRPPSLLDSLMGMKTENKKIEINVIPEHMKSLKKGRMYYISPSFF